MKLIKVECVTDDALIGGTGRTYEAFVNPEGIESIEPLEGARKNIVDFARLNGKDGIGDLAVINGRIVTNKTVKELVKLLNKEEAK